jgi:hypothetical protein
LLASTEAHVLHIMASILLRNSVSGILAFSFLQIRLARTKLIRKIHAWHRPSCVLKCCFYVLTVLFYTHTCNCNENISTKHKIEQVYFEAENGLCICSVIRASFFSQASPNKYGTNAAPNITAEWLSRIREALGSILDPETCYPGRSVAWFSQSLQGNCVYNTRNGSFPNSYFTIHLPHDINPT